MTLEVLDTIRRRAPFRFLEIHPDNDSGPINGLLLGYCRRRRIKMSRSRPYKKNDNAWVEQRNWTHVRELVGYRRFDTTGEWAVMRELYSYDRLYKNSFEPTMKLVAKVREGGKIHRRYDKAKTPYQRLMESGQLSARSERQLRHRYEALNVAELRRKINQLRQQLFDLVEGKVESGKPRRRGRGISLGRSRQNRVGLARAEAE